MLPTAQRGRKRFKIPLLHTCHQWVKNKINLGKLLCKNSKKSTRACALYDAVFWRYLSCDVPEGSKKHLTDLWTRISPKLLQGLCSCGFTLKQRVTYNWYRLALTHRHRQHQCCTTGIAENFQLPSISSVLFHFFVLAVMQTELCPPSLFAQTTACF